MSSEWFDLGQRFKAAVTQRCVPRLLHAPLVAVQRPVAVSASVRSHRVRVRAASADGEGEGWQADGLRLLGVLGVSLDRLSPATLVVEDPGTLPVLAQLARRVGAGDELEPVAAHVSWWATRADFPDGSGVVDVLAGCRARWVTGQAPAAEFSPLTWARWLGVPSTLTGLLEMHRRVCEAPTLPWLDLLASDSDYSHAQAAKSLADGFDWRRRDTVSRAAVGLRSRCDAADLYAAALLTDPLWRLRAIHTGDVLVGQVVADVSVKDALVEVTSPRLDGRLRVGSEVRGWAGSAAEPVKAGGGWCATVRQAQVVAGQLVLSLRASPGQRTALWAGEQVTLMPAPPSPFRQRSGQAKYRALQYRSSSWLTSGRPAVASRRTVPLDVLLAGAEEPPVMAGGQ